ncbi:RHS repeat-associated core domain-containing protein [Mucilaginibacter sp. HC2]|uniref:DUF6443 domain-containing protein n=1 Tax=Mucilaginibacter inviolabilis TaxID=2714892 RepID=UPI00140A7F1C|nr:DUF6443 domain-containing protein [Mucilaginibacter inviolabilis]NHA06446.1 RHS repeat-associated core domain-containing protein [Mucilaginibacter inviolabilis]
MKIKANQTFLLSFRMSWTCLLVLLSLNVKAQYIPSPAQLNTAATTPGNYFNETSITLQPGFSATATSNNTYKYSISIPDCLPLTNNFSQNLNFIVTTIPRIPLNSFITSQQTSCNLMQRVQYFDGLGRGLQTVQVKGSTLNKDVVQPFTYDQLGREATKYLPYAPPTGISDGSYKSDALTAGAGQNLFYTTPPVGVSSVSYPSSSTTFEASPLSRVLEQGAPGAPWQLSASGVSGSGHTVKADYGMNGTNDVMQWAVNPTGNGVTGGNTYYPANQLYSTTTTDENGNNTIEYKDKEGHIVCKKVQSGSTTYLATYYIYNYLNNLSYVIPPLPAGTAYPASMTESATDAVFLNYAYSYHYDQRNRLIEKKIPGKGWEFMVYNTLDQLVMSQDANQRNKTLQEWSFTKYDAMGRVVMTGTASTNTAADANIASPNRTLFNAEIALFNDPAHTKWETRDNTTTTGYNNVSDPIGTNVTNLTVNYYDDYAFPGKPTTFTTPPGASIMTRGLLTGTKKAVLNTLGNATPDVLWTVQYYDDFGRITQSYSQHYLGGVSSPYNYDLVTNTYDFTSELTASTRQHFTKNTGNTAAVLGVTIVNTYVYDHMGRKTQTLEQINGGSNVLLSQSDYNEIGQLQAKHLHSVAGSPFLQDISYLYNERGWLLKVNDPAIATTPTRLFAEQLNYNLPTNGALAQYDGNISEQVYNAGVSGNRFVKYSYDALNRLTNGISSAGFSESNISYDELGNIKSLTRGTNAPYTYSYVGNQLQTVSGLTGSTYTYDNNGNMLHDGRNNNNITYNMLNLPQTVSGGATITYVYDASGEKLRKISAGVSTDYINGIQYKADGTIDFIQTAEGHANRSGANYVYEYTLTDHLGNNRVAFDQANGKVGEDDYYPFGMNVHRLVNAGNKYLYNQKELQEELTQYDYGARFYDPVIARWTAVDPLTDIYQHWSPYNYVANNPVKNIDPKGETIYASPYGHIYLNTDDGRDDIYVVPWEMTADFIYNINLWTLTQKNPGVLNSRQWNNYWRSKFKKVVSDEVLHRYAFGFFSLDESLQEEEIKAWITGDAKDMQKFQMDYVKSQWSDPVIVVGSILAFADALIVTKLPINLRASYVAEVRGLSKVVDEMRIGGSSSEEIARTVSQMRREIGEKYKAMTPRDELEKIFERNLNKYGDKWGPTIDYLRKQGKSWEDIIESALRTGGKDLGY